MTTNLNELIDAVAKSSVNHMVDGGINILKDEPVVKELFKKDAATTPETQGSQGTGG
jgi:hypothetical protein